jgi:hypothetical protein
MSDEPGLFKLRGDSSGGELVRLRQPRTDMWIHSETLSGAKWKERRYRCVGRETVDNPEFGTLRIMSFQERVDDLEDT